VRNLNRFRQDAARDWTKNKLISKTKNLVNKIFRKKKQHVLLLALSISRISFFRIVFFYYSKLKLNIFWLLLFIRIFSLNFPYLFENDI
jgi:hypothetical protein